MMPMGLGLLFADDGATGRSDLAQLTPRIFEPSRRCFRQQARISN
jgi:hypothetical protein